MAGVEAVRSEPVNRSQRDVGHVDRLFDGLVDLAAIERAGVFADLLVEQGEPLPERVERPVGAGHVDLRYVEPPVKGVHADRQRPDRLYEIFRLDSSHLHSVSLRAVWYSTEPARTLPVVDSR